MKLDRIAKEWLAARQITADALREWGTTPAAADVRAEAILARLAAHDPPILLEMQEAEPEKNTCPHCGASPLITEDRCDKCGELFGLSGQDGNGWNCTCMACRKSNMWSECCAKCRDPIDEGTRPSE